MYQSLVDCNTQSLHVVKLCFLLVNLCFTIDIVVLGSIIILTSITEGNLC